MLEKRRLRRVWQLSRLPEDKLALNKAATELRALLNKIDNDTMTHRIQSLTPNSTDEYSLWKIIKNIKAPITTKAPLKLSDNKWARSDKERAEAFARFLEGVFVPNPVSVDNNNEERVKEYLSGDLQMCLPLNPINPNEIKATIKNMSLKKAPGFDLITTEVLRQLPRKGVVFLASWFNGIIRTAYFPKIWKVSQITMIHKSGKPINCVSSYRPISLLPILSKLFEKLLLKRLNPHVAENG